uniref:Peptidase C1A papain C-terminal domain-containing protein n=1 Tax=Euplotes harpa TaxID=151035 RepID=A0A7S3JEA4_9SPIT
MVETIKKSTNLWTPVEPEENIFRFHSREQLVGMMGAKIDLERDRQIAGELGLFGVDNEGLATVPAAFDSREQWSMCPFDIKDQGQCGSCWAFGAVETLEDRVCISSKGAVKSDLSEQNMVSCDWVGFGCSGGWPISAFSYLSLLGVPTEECVPYTSGKSGEAWGCTYECADKSVSSQRYRCKYPWINFTLSGIKNEIFERGPVETAFWVYEDFMSYKSGIYHHTTGQFLGGHAVKIVGWGVEDNVNYWIVANSWSTSWGENGYFRIRLGDSGIGEVAYSCSPYQY